MSVNSSFVHHVFFWLSNPGSTSDVDALMTGLKKLAAISSVRHIQIGVPADTRRPVIDHTYSASLLLIFDDKAGHDSYQDDPLHVEFVKNCSPLWNKVTIYDSESR
jgi:hypothetical protein